LETNLDELLVSAYGHAAISEPAVTGTAPLSVSAIDGVTALEQFAAEIDALNAASERPNPFLSGGFLLAYSQRREYGTPDSVERLFLIREGNRLIGCFPMLIAPDAVRMGNKSIKSMFRTMMFLGHIDTEQPAIISAPQDQERCAKALIDHLCNHTAGWDLIHLGGQLPSGPLYKAAYAAAGWKTRVRNIDVAPYNEILISWNDLGAYFRSLAQKMRSNISRQARKLYAAGEVKLVYADGASAAAWFDAYCDLDSRSWKDGTPGSIRRHPGRIELYRDVSAGKAGFEPSFIGILLDGVLVAGLIAGSNQLAAPHRHGIWALEMAYDVSHSKLGPGQLLFLLAMGQAIDQQHRHLNFMQNFDHYKHRWGATRISVTDVQIMRQFSVRNALAALGDLRKWLRQRKAKPAGEASSSEEVTSTHDTDEHKSVSPEQLHHARQLAERALATGGSSMKVLDRDAARGILPFDIG
jgi:Acetyltransferase (GNAT) domain